jgi:predicted phage terminase large subunit-like protein
MAGIREMKDQYARLNFVLRPPVKAAVAIDRTLEEEREQLRGSLYEFVKVAWSIVEPHRPFVDGWHIRVICEHLQAITERQIRNLIINIPPRHMKSTLVCVLWPAWEWIRAAQLSYLTSSYADSLSIRDAVKTRRLITSVWYRERWGSSFKLAADQNAKIRYDNDRGGYRIATSVQGIATGEGGDRIIVDDPHNVLQVESDTMRDSGITWWDESMSSRGNDPKTVAFVIVMQRVHYRDLTGHCLEKGGYEHLCLPAEWDGKRRRTSLGYFDKRKVKDELLWPERFGRAELADLKKKLGTYGASGQLQQEPIPEGGGVFKLAWFPRYHHAPAGPGMTTVSIDCANKAKELNDYSVAGAFREPVDDPRAFVLDVRRERLEYPGLKRFALNFCSVHKPDQVLIEDKGNGTPLIQDLRSSTRLPIIEIEPEGDKIMRAQRAAPTCESGLIVLPYMADWLLDWEAEIGRFPLTDWKDQVDMLTQYIDRFARGSAPAVASSGARTMMGVKR